MKNGRVHNEWIKARDLWIKENSANHEGQWYCIVGGGYLTEQTLQLDHDISRIRDPSRRTDQTNLHPICSKHNAEKGSKSLKEYKPSSLNCSY